MFISHYRQRIFPTTLIPIDVIAQHNRQSSTLCRCLLDRPVEPGDDSKACINLNNAALIREIE
jgi:hypothetical protein